MVWVVRKTNIREMLFPDTRVIIPRLVQLKIEIVPLELILVQSCRELSWQVPGSESANFPVFFPVSREFDLENGSLETPSTARESL
jgi:hypothetical protein